MTFRLLWLALVVATLLGCRPDGSDAPASGPEDQSESLPVGTRLIVVDANGVEDDRRARRLAPGEDTVFSVRVEDQTGAPVPDVRLRFVAPDRPVRGGFPEAGDDHVLATTTDGEGYARATFVAIDTGVFSVDVTVDDTLLVDSFAVSAWDELLEPPVPLEEIDGALPASIEVPEGALVRGPFLLPAMTTIHRAGEDEAIDATHAPSWMLWIDHEPMAMYGHPTTFVTLHGAPIDEPEACGARYLQSEEMTWPEIVLPGREVESLLSPLVSNERTLPADHEPRQAEVPGTGFRAHVDDCALVLYGSHFEQGEEKVSNFFRNTYGVGWIESATGQDAVDKWKSLVAQASQQTCERLFVYLLGHGNESGKPTVQLTRTERVPHADIAAELEKHFAASSVDLQIYLATCFGERMIAEYQGRGLEGRVYASSSWYQPTWTIGGVDLLFREVIKRWDEVPTATLQGTVNRIQLEPPQEETPQDAYQGLVRMDPQHVALDPGFQDWDMPDLVLDPRSTTRLEIVRPPSNSDQAPDGRVMPMRLELDGSAMPKFEFKLPKTNLSRDFRIDDGQDSLAIDVVARPPADAAFTQTYEITSRSKYAAYRGTGTIHMPDPGPPPPPAIVCRERKESIDLVAEVDGAAGTANHMGVPTLNDEHEILAWGAIGNPSYELIRARCGSFCDTLGASKTIADPQVPVPLPTGATPMVTDASYPRRLTDQRRFAFHAWLGGDEHAIIRYANGRYDILARFNSPDARGRFTEHLRTSSKGSVLWGTHDDAILSDDLMPSQSLYRFTGTCSEWIAEAGWGMVGTSHEISRLYPEAILADDTVLYTAAADNIQGTPEAVGMYRYSDDDNVDPIVWLSGDAAPVGPGTITDVRFAGATDDGIIVAWLGIRVGADEYRNSLVRLEKDGTVTELMNHDGLAPLLPFEPAQQATVTETFVGLDGQVAVLARLTDASPPYATTGSILYMEHRGAMKVVAMEGEPHCGGPWVWSNLVDTDVAVWGTGLGTAYFRAYARPADGGDAELGLYRWSGGKIEEVINTDILGVLLNGGEHRTLTDFGIARPTDTGSEREWDTHLSVNNYGELAIDVYYEPDAQGRQGRGIFLIGG